MEEILRSLRGEDRAYVRFINKTDREIEIIWINFTGSYVNYRVLERDTFVDINTFKGHPWIALDHTTKDRLHIEKEFVYHPKTTQEYLQIHYPGREVPPEYEARVRAIITLPVYSLRYRAMLEIRNHLRNEQQADQLELPKQLIDDLKRCIIQRNNQLAQPILGII